MSQRPTEQQTITTQDLDQILQSFSDLEYKARQNLKKYLLAAKINTALIREAVIQQGRSQKKGILIIQGILMISKKVANGRIIFSQLNTLQIANIQVFMYDRAHYSAIVHSSQLKYIEISQSILYVLYQHTKERIQEKEKARTNEIEAKLKQIAKSLEKKEKQKMIDRLSLPAIKYFSKENKDSHSTNDLHRKGSQSPKEESSRGGLGQKQRSYTLVKKNIPKTTDLKQIEPPRRLQQKQVTTVQVPEDRNERIFKQQLKAIIKRKLVYERKQLGVLKAYRHNHNDHKVIYEEDANYAQPETNQIDQYFKF